jgi:tetratricopeptide (TPR) repeat protein
MKKNTLILFALAIIFAAGCATGPEPVREPVEWKLSSEAALTYYYLKAQDEVVRGNFIEAAGLFGNAIQQRPEPSLYIEMARSYWRGRDRDMAIKSMQDGIQAFPEEPGLYFFLAELFLGDDRKEQAVDTLEEYREAVPDDPDVYQDLALFYMEMSEYPKVLDLLEKLPEDKRSAEALYYMGRASIELGDRKRAVSFLRMAVDKNPVFLQAWAELAFIYERERDYVQAEDIYEKLLDIGEKNPDLILRIIELNLKLNNPDKALMFLDKGPVDVQFRLDVAHQFINNGFYSHAYEILQGIRERGAYSPAVYFYLALIAYNGSSEPDEALKYLGKVPEGDYYHLQALFFSVQIHFEQEQYEEGLELTRQGRRIHPSESRFFLFESIMYEVLGDYSAALEITDSGLEKWPTDTDLLFRKGTIWDKKGDKDKTIDIMEQIIAIDQDHHEALNYVGYTLAEQNMDLDRAHVLISRALKLDPVNAYYIDSLAWVYYMQGEYGKAWKEIKRAVELVDDDPVIWEHYGDIAKVMENRDEAIYGYETALENEPDDAENIMKKIEMLRQLYQQ